MPTYGPLEPANPPPIPQPTISEANQKSSHRPHLELLDMISV